MSIWLEALQKTVNPTPRPTLQPKSAGDPFLDAVISRALYEVEPDAAVTKTAVFMEDADNASVPDPVGELVEKTQQDQALTARSARTVWRNLPESEEIALVETEIAKIIGARAEDMAPLEK